MTANGVPHCEDDVPGQLLGPGCHFSCAGHFLQEQKGISQTPSQRVRKKKPGYGCSQKIIRGKAFGSFFLSVFF